MGKGSYTTTIRGLQTFVFPYFLRRVWLWKSSKLHRSYPWPTGYLVTQVTGMNHSFSLSKLTPWLSTLSLTLVGCRLCNGKQEGEESVLQLHLPGARLTGECSRESGWVHSCKIRKCERPDFWSRCGSGHWKKGNSHWRERLIFFLRFFLKMTCQ